MHEADILGTHFWALPEAVGEWEQSTQMHQ